MSLHDRYMELQQLRYVVALAEERSFTRAAAKCFVAQSALSHQIKALENEIGVVLFNRTSRRVELTAGGVAFLEAARMSLNAAERAATDAAATVGLVRGRLSVGTIPTETAVDLPAALKRFHSQHPQVRIALQVAGSDDLEIAIARGEIDIGLLGLPENRYPRGVAWRHLATDRLAAVLSSVHPLAGRRRLRLDDLSEETFADFPAGTPAREESDLAFAAAHIKRDVAFESMATNLTLDLIRRNLAVALLPSRYVPSESGLVSIELVKGPSRLEYIAWSDFNPSAAAQAFLNSVEA